MIGSFFVEQKSDEDAKEAEDMKRKTTEKINEVRKKMEELPRMGQARKFFCRRRRRRRCRPSWETSKRHTPRPQCSS